MGGLFSYFRTKRNDDSPASLAKQRLQIVIAQDHTGHHDGNYMLLMKREILAVIQKYIQVERNAVSVSRINKDGCDFLEVNVSLPEGGPNEHSNDP